MIGPACENRRGLFAVSQGMRVRKWDVDWNARRMDRYYAAEGMAGHVGRPDTPRCARDLESGRSILILDMTYAQWERRKTLCVGHIPEKMRHPAEDQKQCAEHKKCLEKTHLKCLHGFKI